MTINEYLKKLKSTEVDDDAVDKIEKKYAKISFYEAKQVISLAGAGGFLDGGKSVCRKLSLDDILDADAELNLDFPEKGIIPFFDRGDNDYIVFDVNKRSWEMFNIVDEISFKSEKALEDILQ